MSYWTGAAERRRGAPPRSRDPGAQTAAALGRERGHRGNRLRYGNRQRHFPPGRRGFTPTWTEKPWFASPSTTAKRPGPDRRQSGRAGRRRPEAQFCRPASRSDQGTDVGHRSAAQELHVGYPRRSEAFGGCCRPGHFEVPDRGQHYAPVSGLSPRLIRQADGMRGSAMMSSPRCAFHSSTAPLGRGYSTSGRTF